MIKSEHTFRNGWHPVVPIVLKQLQIILPEFRETPKLANRLSQGKRQDLDIVVIR